MRRDQMVQRIAAQAAAALMQGLEVTEVSLEHGVKLADGTCFGGIAEIPLTDEHQPEGPNDVTDY